MRHRTGTSALACGAKCLKMRDGFFQRNHHPPLKSSDSSRLRSQQTLLSVSCCCSKSLIWGSLAAFFVISSLFSLLASLCALLSSLFSLLPSLFSHPSLLSSLFSLLSLLSSLFSRCCSFLRSHFALVTSNFASGHRIRFQLNPLDPLPHHPWPGGMREAIK